MQCIHAIVLDTTGTTCARQKPPIGPYTLKERKKKKRMKKNEKNEKTKKRKEEMGHTLKTSTWYDADRQINTRLNASINIKRNYIPVWSGIRTAVFYEVVCKTLLLL